MPGRTIFRCPPSRSKNNPFSIWQLPRSRSFGPEGNCNIDIIQGHYYQMRQAATLDVHFRILYVCQPICSSLATFGRKFGPRRWTVFHIIKVRSNLSNEAPNTIAHKAHTSNPPLTLTGFASFTTSGVYSSYKWFNESLICTNKPV